MIKIKLTPITLVTLLRIIQINDILLLISVTRRMGWDKAVSQPSQGGDGCASSNCWWQWMHLLPLNQLCYKQTQQSALHLWSLSRKAYICLYCPHPEPKMTTPRYPELGLHLLMEPSALGEHSKWEKWRSKGSLLPPPLPASAQNCKGKLFCI